MKLKIISLAVFGLCAVSMVCVGIFSTSKNPIKNEGVRILDSPSHSSQPGVVSVAKQSVHTAIQSSSHRSPELLLWNATPSALLELYKSGLTSHSARDKYVAWLAVDYCLPIISGMPFPENPAADGTQARMIAAARSALNLRCAEFYRVPPATLRDSKRELRLQLDTSGSGSGSGFAPIDLELARMESDPSEVGRVRSQLGDALNLYGTSAMLWVSGSLSGWLEYASGDSELAARLDASLRNPATIGAAIALSQCMMGYPCGTDSLAYMTICSNTGFCGNSVQEGLQESVKDPVAWETTVRQATVIANAVRLRDLSALGLRYK